MDGTRHPESTPTIRFNLDLAEPLAKQLAHAGEETGRSVEEIVRKALTLYLACRDGVKAGQQVSLTSPSTGEVVTKFLNV